MALDLQHLRLARIAGGVEFDVKVVPGASRTRLVGLWGQALKLAVAAPPADGRANSAVVALLAELLGVKRGEVSIRSGHAQPHKRVAIAGVTAEVVRARLQGAP